MQHHKILNSLNEANDCKLVTRKWNIANDNSNSNYAASNKINHNTKILKSNLCDYNDACIFVTGGIRKLTTGQDEDYTAGCLLDYDYIKNQYWLTAVDLSRQKELGADPKAIQQIKFVRQLNKLDNDGSGTDAGANQSMFFLTILGKIKGTRLQFSQGSVTVL